MNIPKQCLLSFLLISSFLFSADPTIYTIAWPEFNAAHVRARAQLAPGDTIIPAYLPNTCIAKIIDMQGKTKYSLRDATVPPQTYYGSYVIPYDATSYIALLYNKNIPTNNIIEKIDVAKGVLWRTQGTFHHELQRDAQGNIYTLNEVYRKLPGKNHNVLDNELVILDRTGKIKKTISLGTMIARQYPHFDVTPQKKYRLPADVFHTNALSFIDQDIVFGKRTVCRKGDMVISMRHLNCVFVFNPQNNKIVWLWGRGELQWQHHATVSGNVLTLFDNGADRKYSRILRIDIPTQKILAEYQARNKNDFFSEARGSVQVLQNGNFLICNSNAGQVVEIDTAGKVVWQYLTAERILVRGKKIPAPVYRAMRYPQAPGAF